MKPAALLILVLPGLLGQAPEAKVPDGAKSKADLLLALHTADAERYAITRDPARAEALELRREPVYRWTNPIAAGASRATSSSGRTGAGRRSSARSSRSPTSTAGPSATSSTRSRRPS